MSAAAAIRRMLAAGLSIDQALTALEAFEAENVGAKSAGAERTRRWRERKAERETVTRDVTVTPVTVVTSPEPAAEPECIYNNHARADGNPNPFTTFRDINNPLPSEGPPRGSAAKPKAEVRAILSECLSAQTADDLIAHRTALRSKLTPGAAKGLVKAFAAYGDPEGAALAMMANGWRGFNPDWMKNRARAGPAHERRDPVIAAGLALMEEYRLAENSSEYPDDYAECAPVERLDWRSAG